MAKNTASGLEIVAIADLADATKPCNLAPGAATALRMGFYKSLSVAVTGATLWNKAGVSAAAAGTKIEDLVIFTSSAHGEPWVRTEALTWSETVAPADTMADAPAKAVPTANSTVIFPNVKYKDFK